MMRPENTVQQSFPWTQLDTALEKLDALEETLEILHDEELMASFREGVQELAEGKGRPWEDVKKELGLE
ncbi:MAG: hypothetical protein E6J33_10000 [Chloroflexi bacterium]|nr:MAG: hypothetical protein E6J33_10000 [Chloroflexota bacterium]